MSRRFSTQPITKIEAAAEATSVKPAPQRFAPAASPVDVSRNPAVRTLGQAMSGLSYAGVTDIDPSAIDESFIADRMGQTDEAYRDLVKAISEKGQQVPIMVRPHPQSANRYQVVYGRRRLRAARELGLKVKAMVKTMNDEDLVVVQGQENSAREDLSFIERAFFALRLEERGFGREIVQSALVCDKSTASILVSIAKSMPADIIESIGAAHGVGKPRWLKLSRLFKEEKATEAGRKAMEAADFAGLDSKAKFGRVTRAAETALAVKDRDIVLRTAAGLPCGKMVETRATMTIVIDKAKHPKIAELAAVKMQGLISAAGV